MGPRLVVETASFEAASAAVGLEIAGRVQRSALGVLDGLAGSAGMAGSGPGAAQWARAYDDSAAATLAASQDVVNACYQLAALLQQTGFNYSRAESHSTPGNGEVLTDVTAYASCSVRLGRPPSASGSGGGGATPPGWSIIEHAVRCVWPDGDQGRLRAAAEAWNAGALAIGDAALFVQEALECIAAQVTPEVDAAMAACQAMDRHLWELIAGYRDLARTCEQLAECIDRAHSDIEHELISLAEWSVGIQASGALLAAVTFGISEVGAQGAQQGRITATAIKVATIIEELVAAAGALAESISALSARVVQISRDLNPLLTARIAVASTKMVEALPAAATTEARAVQALATAEANQADLGVTLARSDLSESQSRNFTRYAKKLPAGARDPVITRGANGRVQFSADVPGRVPGSYATYTKVVDSSGVTTSFYKTTVAPDGSIVHIKVKLS